MSDRQITTVLFDLGDTLLNFGKFKVFPVFQRGAQASYDYLKSQGQPVENFGLYLFRNFLNLRIKRFISSLTGNDLDVIEVFKKVGGKRGIKLSDEQWLEFAWCWYEPLSRMGRIEPDLKETLTSLKDAGLKLAIVSNTFVAGHSLDRHLQQFGLLELFTVRLYSYQFEFRKPDPRIFEEACRRIGCQPQNTAFVGDRIDVDIQPAMKMGMYGVLKDAYTNAGKSTPPGAAKIKNISELPGLIDKINQEGAATKA